MFCQQCGHEITGTEKFCPKCGRQLNFQTGNGSGSGSSRSTYDSGTHETYHGTVEDGGKKGKTNWQDYLTMENIERFAPAAALMPIAMAIVMLVVGVVLGAVFGGLLTLVLPRAWVIASVITFLIGLVFCLATLAAACGLFYVAVKKKNMSVVWTWVAPVAVACGFISCVCIAFGYSAPAWIFGIISVVLGVEMFARITIANNPMDTPIQPGKAFDTYGEYYHRYKEKYQSNKKESESTYAAGSANAAGSTYDAYGAGGTQVGMPADSYFDGKGVELFGYTILGAILCTITCGIATPWVICKIYRWRISHTVVNGKRFTFDGTGASLLGHWILWELLTIITCGIYGFFTYVAVRKWELKHTFIDGEPVVMGADVSYFDGNSFEYLGYSILSGIMICITCGIAYPWMMCMIQKWDTKHQVVNGRRLAFDGSGLAFLGEYIIIFLLTLITCGIYSPWGIVRMQKYIIKHTHFEN